MSVPLQIWLPPVLIGLVVLLAITFFCKGKGWHLPLAQDTVNEDDVTTSPSPPSSARDLDTNQPPHPGSLIPLVQYPTAGPVLGREPPPIPTQLPRPVSYVTAVLGPGYYPPHPAVRPFDESDLNQSHSSRDDSTNQQNSTSQTTHPGTGGIRALQYMQQRLAQRDNSDYSLEFITSALTGEETSSQTDTLVEGAQPGAQREDPASGSSASTIRNPQATTADTSPQRNYSATEPIATESGAENSIRPVKE